MEGQLTVHKFTVPVRESKERVIKLIKKNLRRSS